MNGTTQQSRRQHHKPGSIRYAEKRRMGTCAFADRIAKASLDEYRRRVPHSFREAQRYNCVSAIVAHYYDSSSNVDRSSGDDSSLLQVVGLGVGTKFLSEKVLREELLDSGDSGILRKGDDFRPGGYGRRVRDCHAEVLARRAFRLFLYRNILWDIRRRKCLESDINLPRHGSITKSRPDCGDILGRDEGAINEDIVRWVERDTWPILERINILPTGSSSAAGLSEHGRNGHTEDSADNDHSINSINNCCTMVTMSPKIKYKLRVGVTLHLYTSSAPCGNATLKKFTSITKERYDDTLRPWEWPVQQQKDLQQQCGNSAADGGMLLQCHDTIKPHGVRLGQFALLVKLNNNNASSSSSPSQLPRPLSFSSKYDDRREMKSNLHYGISNEYQSSVSSTSSKQGEVWPCDADDSWCPTGTSTVHTGKGSVHTCSDKICRWNCLGLQGAMLSSLLYSPIYLTSVTIGRKMAREVCRRALCCRAHGFNLASCNRDRNFVTKRIEPHVSCYKLTHPSLMGTGIYMNESGVLNMSSLSNAGSDVRFNSCLCWVWSPNFLIKMWPLMECPDGQDSDILSSELAECINGNTGLVHVDDKYSAREKVYISGGLSMVSTASLLYQHQIVRHETGRLQMCSSSAHKVSTQTLGGLRWTKRRLAPKYEAAKDHLINKHPVFCNWRRRERNIVKSRIS